MRKVVKVRLYPTPAQQHTLANCYIDRDVNAARNCRDEGLRILFSSGTGETANGGSIRPRRGRKSTVVATACEVGSRARIL